jgi:hypothetical protein
LTRDDATGRPALAWNPGGGKAAWLWVLYSHVSGEWRSEILPAVTTGMPLPEDPAQFPDRVAVSAVDRTGNESLRAALSLKAAE